MSAVGSPEQVRRHLRGPAEGAVLEGFVVAELIREVRHLAKLRDRLGDRFVAGVVLTTGPTALSLGERLLALPISVLWDSS